jgi:hypothetical protein
LDRAVRAGTSLGAVEVALEGHAQNVIHKRGFPAAVRPEKRDHLTGFDSEGYVLEHMLAIELDAEALNLNDARVQLHAWPAFSVARFDSMTEM